MVSNFEKSGHIYLYEPLEMFNFNAAALLSLSFRHICHAP